MSEPRTKGARIRGVGRWPWELIALTPLSLYFLARLLYFALGIVPDLPPDESTHVGLIRQYSQALFIPADSAESFQFGLIRHTPYLYYLVMGKVLTLNFFGVDDYVFLRLWNVLLAMVTLYVAYRLSRQLAGDTWVRVLYMVMVTNTLMFTFLSAAVSYDNLVNLLAVLGLWLLFWFLGSGETLTLLGFVLVVALGCLTKLSFLPLAAVLAGILVLDRRLALVDDLARLGQGLRGGHARVWILFVLAAIGSIAAGALYGGNLIRYSNLVPSCSQVLEVEECMENRIFARNRILSEYRGDKLSFDEAIVQTQMIQHAGDRDHALRLLSHERAYKANPQEALNVVDYSLMTWKQAMMPTIYGIQAHRSILKTPNQLLPYSLILFLGFVLWVRHLTFDRGERPWLWMVAASVAYFLILVSWYNYRSYLGTHAPLLGVQGRYLFPVMFSFYLVLSRALLAPKNLFYRAAAILAISWVFVQGDMVFFLRHVGSAWFR